jgi:PPK2 family polyphosphate:nucleotide phosphotransferase
LPQVGFNDLLAVVKQPFVIKSRIHLSAFQTDFTDGWEKEDAAIETSRLRKRIGELQSKLYANTGQALLVIFQGMDCSGKDGATKSLLDAVNPAGTEVISFKAPSTNELAHDYLWRIHQAIPSYGHIGVFNRSHYEDVLVVRVMELQPKDIWKKRYDQINDFERHLSQNGYTLLKFFLHISREEQAGRLVARLQDKTKNWKFESSDLKMRERWDGFMDAYEDALNKCSTREARWHLVPADRKWYRDLVIARRVVEALEDMDLKWPAAREDLSKVTIP